MSFFSAVTGALTAGIRRQLQRCWPWRGGGGGNPGQGSGSALLSGTQGHVAQQPLLGLAVTALPHGGNHLVLLRWLIQTLVAVDMPQGELLQQRRVRAAAR